MAATEYIVRTPDVQRRSDYAALLLGLKSMSPREAHDYARHLAKTDLFFLGVYVLGRKDADNEFVFERCREVQAEPNGWLDLWAREHFKSTIITNWLTVQDILNDPELTFGIFSHTRPIAKAFLRQIKLEFERNEWLKALFPEVLWQDPRKESSKWNEDEGIVVKRRGNPKEATIEAWGLVDGQPTSKHYKVRVYDDIVVPGSVTTPEMIAKTTEHWQLSDNLGVAGGDFRVAGTRYHFNDTYGEMMRQKVVQSRVYPCTRDGTDNFTPENCVLMTPDTLAQKRRNQGLYTFSTQMLLDPKGDSSQGFRRDWLRYTKADPHGRGLNVYLIVDPANSKRKRSDWTVIGVIGLGPDRNYTLLDVIRDRLSLKERADAVFDMHEKWQPIGVGYEEYGLQADIQFIEHLQEERNYRFKITPLGGSMSKTDRIKRLMPIFEQGRFILPHAKYRTIYDKSTVNLIEVFVEEEYVAFPVATHDDFFDMLSRIEDPEMGVKWPLSDVAKLAKRGPVQRFTTRDERHAKVRRYGRK